MKKIFFLLIISSILFFSFMLGARKIFAFYYPFNTITSVPDSEGTDTFNINQNGYIMDINSNVGNRWNWRTIFTDNGNGTFSGVGTSSTYTYVDVYGTTRTAYNYPERVFSVSNIPEAKDWVSMFINDPKPNAFYCPGNTIQMDGTISINACTNSITAWPLYINLNGVYAGVATVYPSWSTSTWSYNYNIPNDFQSKNSNLIFYFEQQSYLKGDSTGPKHIVDAQPSIPITILPIASCGSLNETYSDNDISSTNSNLCPTSYTEINFKSIGGINDGDRHFTWNCTGPCGTSNQCIAYEKSNNSCNPLTNNVYTRTKPTTNLCNLKTTYATPTVSGDGSASSPWKWTCKGAQNGTTGLCTALGITDGVCGPANAENFSNIPTATSCKEKKNCLCTTGTASKIAGTGPWTWTCAGANGGATQSCSANKINCGSANLGHFSSTPTCNSSTDCTNLCTAGTPSEVYLDSVASYYYWACSDEYENYYVNCGAYHYNPAACGSLSGGYGSTTPSGSDLCAVGTASSVSLNGVKWSWSCTDSRGGTSQCIFNYFQPGICNANTVISTYASAPASTSLCTAGNASAVTKNDLSSNHTYPPYLWSWTCAGIGYSSVNNLASTATCYAYPPKTPGQCGSANGVAVTSTPNTDLCSLSTPSPVYTCYNSSTGINCDANNPYYWYCQGDIGTNATYCTAPLKGQCGPINNTNISTNAPPVYGLCSSGLASTVSGNNPYTWTCLGSSGGGNNSGTCTALYSPVVCGSASSSISNQGSAVAPTTNLCGTGGKPSSVTWFAFGNYWSWYCYSADGMTHTSCYTTYVKPSVCGSANGTATSSMPIINLCSSGNPSSVSGGASAGVWNWTCVDPNYTAGQVSCSAPYSQTGICGSANGSSGLTIPTTNLCAIGTAVNYYGQPTIPMTEPRGWYWYCSAGGVLSPVCEYTKTTSGYASCGPIAGTISNTTPTCNSSTDCTNLCTAGSLGSMGQDASQNWQWKCLGSTRQKDATCYAYNNISGTCGEAARIFQQGENWSSDFAYCSTGTSCPLGSNCLMPTNPLPLGTDGGSITQWKCNGINGGQTSAICTATRATDGVCGSANRTYLTNSFGTDTFCDYGILEDLSGNKITSLAFPTANNSTQWKCVGANGGTTVNCSASYQATGLNGSCNSQTNGKYFSSVPTSNLCSSPYGNSDIFGSGPWSWTCNGSKTGLSSSTCIANLTPSIPAPTINNCFNNDESKKLLTKTSVVSFSWPYNSNYNFKLKISESNNSNDFYDYIGTEKTIYIVDDPILGEPQISFGKTYYWWLQLTDNFGNASDWIEGPSFTAPTHYYPTPEIGYAPKSPLVRNPIYFDASKSISFNRPTYLWTFEDGSTSNLSAPNSRIFNNVGLYTEKLKVCDEDSYCCDISTGVKVDNALSLPKWKEISPF